jgi:hypothetical protein
MTLLFSSTLRVDQSICNMEWYNNKRIIYFTKKCLTCCFYFEVLFSCGVYQQRTKEIVKALWDETLRISLNEARVVTIRP